MKFRISAILFAAAALILAVASCKKEETTKEDLSGSLTVKSTMPSYVKVGDRYTFVPSGVSAPDGTDVGYYFYNKVKGVSDTLKNGATEYVFVVPDTLGVISLSCTAYPIQSADKYYAKSGSISFMVVSDDPEQGSLTDVPRSLSDETVTIEGRSYYAGRAGGRTWLRGNLSVIRRDAEGNEVFGRSFADAPAMQNIFGAYYTWEEARTACPAGWHLPDGNEWVALLKEMGAPDDLQPLQDAPCGAGKLMANGRFNGERLWDYYRGVNIENVALSALPLGYCEIAGDKRYFLGYPDYAVFWTADEQDGKGVYRYIYKESDKVFVGLADKSGFGASVRCVK